MKNSWPPGLGTNSFGLGFGICGLTASALWRITLGTMMSVTFYPGSQTDAYWPGARERFFIVRAGCSPPFLLPSSPFPFPFLSLRLEVGPYFSRSLPSISFPSHVKNHNYHNQPLVVGNGCVQNKTSSKECTIT